MPVAHLPKLDYLPVIQRGAPDGVAPLDAQGKVPAANLPAAEDAIPLAQKGQPNGVAALAADGKVPARAAASDRIDSHGLAWAPKRGGIWAGWIPGDGQLVSRATFPDLAAAVADGVVPVVSEAEWLADPLKRGAYTLGDGATSIRVPDYNGKSAGAIGAAFLEAMAPCPWTMARSRPARTRLMPTRSNPRSIWGRNGDCLLPRRNHNGHACLSSIHDCGGRRRGESDFRFRLLHHQGVRRRVAPR